MNNILTKMLRDKREWKQLEKRVSQLPEDYIFVYHKIQNYMWYFVADHAAGKEMINVFSDILELFEEGVANEKSVLEITGEDVAFFCDELVRNSKTYIENWRDKLNREIYEKVGKK